MRSVENFLASLRHREKVDRVKNWAVLNVHATSSSSSLCCVLFSLLILISYASKSSRSTVARCWRVDEGGKNGEQNNCDRRLNWREVEFNVGRPAMAPLVRKKIINGFSSLFLQCLFFHQFWKTLFFFFWASFQLELSIKLITMFDELVDYGIWGWLKYNKPFQALVFRLFIMLLWVFPFLGEFRIRNNSSFSQWTFFVCWELLLCCCVVLAQMKGVKNFFRASFSLHLLFFSSLSGAPEYNTKLMTESAPHPVFKSINEFIHEIVKPR